MHIEIELKAPRQAGEAALYPAGNRGRVSNPGEQIGCRISQRRNGKISGSFRLENVRLWGGNWNKWKAIYMSTYLTTLRYIVKNSSANLPAKV